MRLRGFVKFLIVIGIAVWLFYSGQYDFSALQASFVRWPWLLVAQGTLTLVFFAGALRWHLLLRAQDIGLPVRDTLRLTAIGFFFSTLIPGGVSGDVVKLYYVDRLFSGRRIAAGLSILVDRMLGLGVMMAVAAVALLLRWSVIATIPPLRALASPIALALGVLVTTVTIGLSDTLRNSRWATWLTETMPLAERIYTALHAHKRHPLMVGAAVAFSALTSLGSGFAFFALGRALGIENLSLADYLFAIPLVLVAITIPLAPAGIGVGQAAALFIFQRFAGIPQAFGFNLITLYQAAVLILAFAGAVIYLTYRHRAPVQPHPQTTAVP